MAQYTGECVFRFKDYVEVGVTVGVTNDDTAYALYLKGRQKVPPFTLAEFHASSAALTESSVRGGSGGGSFFRQRSKISCSVRNMAS